MKLFYIVMVTALSELLISCSSLSESPKQEEPVAKPVEPAAVTVHNEAPATQPAKDSSKMNDEVFLQQARLMNRMGEIESELKSQREKIRLLEQGLLTGIAPDGLRKSRVESSAKDSGESVAMIDQAEDHALSAPNLESLNGKPSDPKSAEVKATNPNSEVKGPGLEVKLKLVQDLYQASRFGVAISELAALSREFGENAADGRLHVWLGKSYARLREYSTARVELESYLKNWPAGSDVADVRLELAKVYAGLGLKERARRELRQVMKDFAGQESSEIASAEFSKMQGGL